VIPHLLAADEAVPRADAEDSALATRLWAELEKIVQAL
jgi:hypothetical protein